MRKSTISSGNYSFVDFMGLIVQQPDHLLHDVKQIILRNPRNMMFASEVVIRTNGDQRPVTLEDTDVVFDKIVLAKTETGVGVGIQRQGDLPYSLFRAIAAAFQTTRNYVDWGRYNHAKGQFAGTQLNDVVDYDFYYDENVAIQLQGAMPIEPGKKRSRLDATNWELVFTPTGKIFLQVLGQKGQIFQTTLDPKSLQNLNIDQVAQTIGFDQVQRKQNDKVTSFVSIPNPDGNKRPLLIVAGQKGTYFEDSTIIDEPASTLSVDARTGLVGFVADNRFYTTEIRGDKHTPIQAQSDQLDDDFTPLFSTNPRLLLNADTAIVTNVVTEGRQRISYARVLPTLGQA